MGNRVDDLAMFELHSQPVFSDTLQRRLVDLNVEHFKRLGEPYISGIEVTQGIQYYQAHRHLTNANDRGDDNSVTLVANKPAWARVYVRSGFWGFSQSLTGELEIQNGSGPLTQCGTL